MKPDLCRLQHLLRERLRIIADHALRDSDPALHLDMLREVSAALDDEFRSHRAALPAKLVHFMAQASYEKALAFIEDSAADEANIAAV
ncbi:MAG: hypothetical protein K1X78_05620 [Verrucomicrobiaceae bacterium]|nr:hypothetical protein [Verrucomicrobiaceae bacterium]